MEDTSPKRVVQRHIGMPSYCALIGCCDEDGERVSNITDWGLRWINEHYRKEFGRHFEEAVGGESISAEDIFAYTYAVLHDPVYRFDYENDLLREFPRLPLYHDFDVWRDMGRELLDLHIGFEDAEPYPLELVEKSPPSQPSPVKGEGAHRYRELSPSQAIPHFKDFAPLVI